MKHVSKEVLESVTNYGCMDNVYIAFNEHLI